MDTLKIEIELPQDLLIGLNVPPAEIKQKARERVVLELFREGHISTGGVTDLFS